MPSVDGHCELVQFNTREKWLGGRSIGSSDAATIIGKGYAGTSYYKLWHEKMTGHREPISDKQLKIFEKGHAAEPYIARCMEIDFRWEVRFDPKYSFCRSVRWPFLTCSLDGYMFDEEGLVPLEFKNTSYFAYREWDADSGSVPLKFTVQLQHQMLVTGASRGYLVALCGLDTKAIEVQRDDAFLAVLVKEYERFWNYVQSGSEPPADGSEATFDLLCKKNAVEEMRVERVSSQLAQKIEAVCKADEELKRLEAERQKSLSELVQSVGGAEYLVLPDDRWYSFKASRGGKRMLKRVKGKVRF